MPETMTEVRERPILFSGEMIRAILDGRKTQTRRVATSINPALLESGASPEQIAAAARCPYGQPGDRLWVRETWAWPGEEEVIYRADPASAEMVERWRRNPHYPQVRWRPSIHMPRWASRIALEIAEVRVQRLMEISETDALAEGYPHADTYDEVNDFGEPRVWFADLWDRINAPSGYGWDANPWAWVLTFRRCEP